MLSYQHAYHAGNMADVHKHALLAIALDYMGRKPKPMVYFETHAGRGVYDLGSPEALKTGEAMAGITRAEPLLAPDHPYLGALAHARSRNGPTAYPGSPMIAQALLRPGDRIVLAERHPAEAAALRAAFPGVDVREGDGEQVALALCPPTPRRGLLLIDPSYELKDEFTTMPKLLRTLHRKWPVGVLMLWYPVLASGAEQALTREIQGLTGEILHHRLAFPPARAGHGMIGSGLVVINPPWGLAQAAADLAARLR